MVEAKRQGTCHARRLLLGKKLLLHRTLPPAGLAVLIALLAATGDVDSAADGLLPRCALDLAQVGSVEETPEAGSWVPLEPGPSPKYLYIACMDINVAIYPQDGF